MPKDKITSESRMRENRTFGLMRGREVYRPTLPTLLKIHKSEFNAIQIGERIFSLRRYPRFRSLTDLCRSTRMGIGAKARDFFVLGDPLDQFMDMWT